jgi:hypothetical protein
MSDDAPATQTGSALVPPPVMEIGTLPPRESSRFSRLVKPVRRAILGAMDVADALVEAIQGERS